MQIGALTSPSMQAAASIYRARRTGGLTARSSNTPSDRAQAARSVDTSSVSRDAQVLHSLAAMKSQEQTFHVQGMELTLQSALKEGEDRTLLIKRAGKEDLSLSFSTDSILRFNDQNEPELLSGSAALTNGVLKASRHGDILLREHAGRVDTDVFDATVVSLNETAAVYTSTGGSTSYTGIFTGSMIEDTGTSSSFYGLFNATEIMVQNTGNFDGAFYKSTIKGGAMGNTFQGSYGASTIEGGDGVDHYFGNFIDNSKLYGNAGDDVFTGVFYQVFIDAGEGNNTIGKAAHAQYNTKRGQYEIEPQIADSEIVSGSGHDRLHGVVVSSQVNLGDGDNTIQGIFEKSTVSTGIGNDSLQSLYSRDSSFIMGAGKNRARLVTSQNNTIHSALGTELQLGAVAYQAMGGAAAVPFVMFTHERDGENSSGTMMGAIDGTQLVSQSDIDQSDAAPIQFIIGYSQHVQQQYATLFAETQHLATQLQQDQGQQGLLRRRITALAAYGHV